MKGEEKVWDEEEEERKLITINKEQVNHLLRWDFQHFRVPVPAAKTPTAITSHEDDAGDEQEGEREHDQLKDSRLLSQSGMGLQERVIWRRDNNT